MAYFPDPTDPTQPTADVKASTAAEEFRALKGWVATLAGLAPPGSLPGLTLNSLNGGALAGLRNRVINGDCVVSERSGGVNVNLPSSGAVTYGFVDRWAASSQGAVTVSTRVVLPNNEIRARINGAASNTYVAHLQNIEARNVYDLAGQPLSIGADLVCSISTIVTWELYHPTVANNFATIVLQQQGTIAVTAGVPIRLQVQGITAGANAINGAQIRFVVLGLGAGHTFDIGNVQLEGGNVCTVFERIPFSLNLASCQRYAERVYRAAYSTYGAAAGIFGTHLFWKTVKRATPTVTVGGISYVNASGAIYTPDLSGMLITANVAALGSCAYDATGIVANSELV